MADDQLDDDDTVDDPEQLLERVRRLVGEQSRGDEEKNQDANPTIDAQPTSGPDVPDGDNLEDATIAPAGDQRPDLDPTIAPPTPPDTNGAREQASAPWRRGRWIVIAVLVVVGLMAAFVAGSLLDPGEDAPREALTGATPSAPEATSALPNTAPSEGAAQSPTTTPADPAPTTHPTNDGVAGGSPVDDAGHLDESDGSGQGSSDSLTPTTDPTDTTIARESSENDQDTAGSDEPDPVAPNRPTLTVDGGRRTVTASWSAEDNGSPILEWRINDGRLADEPGPGVTEFVWRDAQVGSHTISVQARNAAGWSEATEKTVDVYDVPSRPTLTANGGPRVVTARWTAEDNGSRILQWQVNDGRLAGGPDETDAGFTWTDAQVGTHTLRVRARNAAGWSEWSLDVVVEVVDTVPWNPSITLVGGINQIQGSWSASGTVTSWVVDDGGLAGGPSSTAQGHVWTNVAAGTYTIGIQACNSTGCSGWVWEQVPVSGPPRSVEAERGRYMNTQNCQGPHCAFIRVTLKGFPPGTYRIECWHREWPSVGWDHDTYLSYQTESSTSEVCVMGEDGITVYVRVIDPNGTVYTSNEYIWPARN